MTTLSIDVDESVAERLEAAANEHGRTHGQIVAAAMQAFDDPHRPDLEARIETQAQEIQVLLADNQRLAGELSAAQTENQRLAGELLEAAKAPPPA